MFLIIRLEYDLEGSPMKNVLIAGVVLALIGSSVLAQGPGGGRPGFGGSMPGGQGGPGMRGGMGGGMMGGGMGGGQRRNPMARIIEELGLTPEQKKKADKVLDDSTAKRKKLDDETKAAIEKILTPAQKKKMEDVQKEMRARFQGMMGGGMMGGGMGRSGMGGPGGAPQGGKPGKKP
jgi:Spy/CpxP family protein refolding chaperone